MSRSSTLSTRRFFASIFIASLCMGAVLLVPTQHASAQQEVRSAMSVSDLQSLINDLLAQVAELKEQLRNKLATEGGSVSSSNGSSVCPYTWTRDLTIGSQGADVMRLQQFLNRDPDTRITSGDGSIGNETNYFGKVTFGAVMRFQNKYRSHVLTQASVESATGYFGTHTRSYMSSLCRADDDTDTETDDIESYTIDDVESVTTRYVDPEPLAADEEYTLFTITLEDDTVHLVRRYGFAPVGAFEDAVRETGYEGDIDDLIDMAEAEEDDTDVSFNVSPASGDAPLSVTFTADFGDETLAYFGGIVIDFGDGAQTSICGPGMRACSGVITQTHTYTSVGDHQALLEGIGEGASTRLGSETVSVDGDDSYTISDVRRVEVESSSNPHIGDSNVYIYTVVLTNGTEYSFSIDLFSVISRGDSFEDVFGEEAVDTGYEGDIEDLIDLIE